MGTRGPLSKKAKRGAKPAAPEKPEKMPPPPEWLGEVACAEYMRVVKEHEGLTAQDAGLLCSYAQSYAEIAEHTQALVKEKYTVKGDRGAVLNPRVRALDAARKSLLSAAQALGLSPSGRARNGEAPELPQNTDVPGQSVMGFVQEHGGDSA